MLKEFLEKKGYDVEEYDDEMIVSAENKWKATFFRPNPAIPWHCHAYGGRSIQVTEDNVLEAILAQQTKA